MPHDFVLETRDGFRKVGFDTDIIRWRDVRILVDGHPAAVMPYPKPASPWQEVGFQLGSHELVAVAQLLRQPTRDEPLGVHYDLFANGRSLSGGPSLAQTRAATPAPGEIYPPAFQNVDAALRIIPAAGAPAMVAGLAGGTHTNWLVAGELLVVYLMSTALAMTFAARAWGRIKADGSRSVRARILLGSSAIAGIFVLALASTFGLILLLRPALGTG
jgi:hypothetical protein